MCPPYQRREAQEVAHKTKPSDTDASEATPMTVALAGVGRIEVPESEAIPAGRMLVAYGYRQCPLRALSVAKLVTNEKSRKDRSMSKGETMSQ